MNSLRGGESNRKKPAPLHRHIGFVSEIRPLKSDLPDYGYDEALGIETSFLSRAMLQSNCSGESQGTAEASNGGSDRLRISAMAVHAAASPTASVTSRE